VVVESVVASADFLQEEHSQNLPCGGFAGSLKSEGVLGRHVTREVDHRDQGDVGQGFLKVLRGRGEKSHVRLEHDGEDDRGSLLQTSVDTAPLEIGHHRVPDGLQQVEICVLIFQAKLLLLGLKALERVVALEVRRVIQKVLPLELLTFFYVENRVDLHAEKSSEVGICVDKRDRVVLFGDGND